MYGETLEVAGLGVLNMTSIRYAESRLSEVAMVNIHRAPELLTCYNQAVLDAARYQALIQYQIQRRELQADQIRAIFIMDTLPAVLEAKQLANKRSPLGSEDIRSSLLAQHEPWINIQSLIHELRCHLELMKAARTAAENAYNSVKKIIGVGQEPTWRQNQNLIVPPEANPSLPADTLAPSLPVDTSSSYDDYFGKPK